MEAITSAQNHEIEEEGHVHPLQIHEIEEESIHSQNVQNEEEEEASPSQVAIDAVWLSLTEEKTKKLSKLLNISADSRSCSIFRVPQNIMNLHYSKFFQPAMVSIGPYYHGAEHLQMIEEHKWRILRGNLDRLKDVNVTLHDLFKAIAVKEKEIRGCYSENIDKFTSHKLIETMILDGCFITELLCVVGELVFPEPNDPLFNMPWMLSSLTRDLLMLENQIPLFVLQILYDKSVADHYEVPSLQELILTLINYTLPRYKDTSKLRKKYKDGTGEHILDFYRWTFIPEVDNDHDAGNQETTIWSRCCCCLSVRSTSKRDEISVGSYSLQPSSKEETTDAKDQGVSEEKLSGNEKTRDARDQGGSEEKLYEIEETTDAKESFQLIQPVDEPRGEGNQFKKSFIHPVKKLCGLSVGGPFPSTLRSRCCCLSVGPSSKKKEINDRSDCLELLSKEETTDARDSNISSSQKETTIHINSLQSLCQEESADQGGSGEKLSEIEETADAKDSFQLIQPVDEPHGEGNQFKKWFILPVKKLGGLLAGVQFPSTLWSRCCCLSVGPSSKKEEINNRSDCLELLSKEETTDARDSNISSSQNETTIRINSLQSLSQEETADQGDSREKLSINEETTDAEESFRLIQHMDEPRGKGNQFKKWFIHPVKKLGGLVGIQFKKKADTDQDLQKTDTDENLLQFIQPVEKLREAGIKFKKREGTDSFLDIDFSHGALRIPLLITGETMSTLILNCIAFEQCYKHRSKHFTSYFNFMGYLINTTFDAGYLREKKIIENFFGTDQELVNFFNEVGKNIPYYFKEDYLMKVAQKVEIYYRNNWHVRWAEFKYKYCGSLWIIMSACAAVFVILLSVLQGFLALYRFIKHSP